MAKAGCAVPPSAAISRRPRGSATSMPAAATLPPNYAEAAHWFRTAAERGHRAAARALGMLHLTGAGVARDPDEAATWFKQAAEAGDAGAQADLASLLQAGVVSAFAQDPPPVHDWFEHAAEQGDLVGAFNFAVCLAEGVGVPRDDDARRLLAEACRRRRGERTILVRPHACRGSRRGPGRRRGRRLVRPRRRGRHARRAGGARRVSYRRPRRAARSSAGENLVPRAASARARGCDVRARQDARRRPRHRARSRRGRGAGSPGPPSTATRSPPSCSRATHGAASDGPQDIEAARRWYEHAVSLGAPEAAGELALFEKVVGGRGNEGDIDAALTRVRRAVCASRDVTDWLREVWTMRMTALKHWFVAVSIQNVPAFAETAPDALTAHGPARRLRIRTGNRPGAFSSAQLFFQWRGSSAGQRRFAPASGSARPCPRPWPHRPRTG